MELKPLNRRWADGLERCALALCFGFFALVALVNLVYTCQVQILFEEFNTELVDIRYDNPLINLAGLAALGTVLALILRREAGKGTVWAVAGGMLLWTAALGIWWVTSVQAQPQSDSKYLWELALAAAGDDLIPVRDSLYLFKFPIQLGPLAYLELVCRAFPAAPLLGAQYLNVFWTVLAYGGVVLLARLVSGTNRGALAAAFLLMLCPQGAFLSTFVYGTIPGMCFCIWGTACLCAYLTKGGWWRLLPAGLLLTLAVVVKMNFAIAVIGAFIVLALHALGKKRMLPLIAGILLAAIALLGPKLVRSLYQDRCGTDFGSGMSNGLWLYTGLGESWSAPGWYGGYDLELIQEYNYEFDQMEPRIRQDIRERWEEFAARPGYALRFFGQKFVSQWCEPEFQSVWSSASAPHAGDPGPAARSLYGGALSRLFYEGSNLAMQLIWCLFAAGLILLFQSSGRNAALPLALMLLGAGLYHMIFEAKAQYLLMWMPLAIPVAAMTADRLARRLWRRDKRPISAAGKE